MCTRMDDRVEAASICSLIRKGSSRRVRCLTSHQLVLGILEVGLGRGRPPGCLCKEGEHGRALLVNLRLLRTGCRADHMVLPETSHYSPPPYHNEGYFTPRAQAMHSPPPPVGGHSQHHWRTHTVPPPMGYYPPPIGYYCR